MSWFSKVGTLLKLLALVLVLPLGAEASRISFHGDGIRANFDSYTVSSNREIPSVEIRLDLPGLEIEKTADGFDELKVEGLTPLEQEGAPAVYSTGSLVAVPEGYEPRLTVLKNEVRELNGVVVKPSQKKFRCHVDSPLVPAFSSALYRSKAVYPENSILLEEVGRLQSLRLVRVGINPIQMDMGNQSLRVTTELVARIDFEMSSEEKPLQLPKTFWRLARKITVNGQTLSHQLRPAAAAEKMLIITADAHKNDIAPLVGWKRAKGLSVDVATYTDAGGTKEKVKEYIQRYYDSASVKPTYLLFVGNKASAPAFMESTGSGSAASDWRFALLSGTDNVPDVLYGRILADNADEIARQVNRWIAYERTPEKAAAWYHDGMTIASSEGSNPSDKEYALMIQEALKKGTYKNTDSFFQGEQTATPTNILNALASGRTWIAYFGHGSGTSWASTNGTFSNSHVAQAQNAAKLPVIIDVACLNASWVNLAKPFGKAWVTHTQNGREAGAVAFYGGSVSISWHPPAVMSVGVAKYHFEKPIPTLGGSVLAGQLYLIEKMGTGSDTLDNMKWYNLFGDPSLLIRTDTPRPYNVKLQTEKLNGSVVVTVKATDSAGAGVGGLTASIATSDQSLAVGRTDNAGQTVLTVDGVGQLEPGTMLTLTGYNAETYETKLQ